MKINLRIFVLISIIGITIVNNCYSQACNDDAYYTLKESTVQLTIDRGDAEYACTGIVIKKSDTHLGVLTAGHCVEEAETIIIDSKYIVSEIYRSKTVDIAYVTINDSVIYKNFVFLGKNSPPKGANIYTLGYVQDHELFNCAKITAIGLENFYSNAKIIAGCSGSGAINSKLELVGLLFGEYENRTSIFINIETIKNFLRSINVDS